MCLGVPGEVLDLGEAPLRMGRVAFGGVARTVSLALVPGAAVGDYVLVHAGTALQVLDPDRAREVLAILAEVLGIPEWMRQLSPFAHLPMVPAEPVVNTEPRRVSFGRMVSLSISSKACPVTV